MAFIPATLLSIKALTLKSKKIKVYKSGYTGLSKSKYFYKRLPIIIWGG